MENVILSIIYMEHLLMEVIQRGTKLTMQSLSVMMDIIIIIQAIYVLYIQKRKITTKKRKKKNMRKKRKKRKNKNKNQKNIRK